MNSQILLYLSRLIILLTAIPIHEVAHGFVSNLLGDPTAKLQGRLTLNPVKHFDPIGTICLLVAGIGWAKPVPVDPRYYKNPRLGMAVTAFAGPLSNFFMGYLAMCAYKIISYATYYSNSKFAEYTALVFYYMTFINIALGIFNLLPVPPFDGSRIVTAFLPEKIYFKIMQYERYIFMVVFLVIAFTNVLDKPLEAANGFVFKIFDLSSSFIDMIAIKALS